MTVTWGVVPYEPGIQIRVSRTKVHEIVFYEIFNSYTWIIGVWGLVLVCIIQSTFWNLAIKKTPLCSHKFLAKNSRDVILLI